VPALIAAALITIALLLGAPVAAGAQPASTPPSAPPAPDWERWASLPGVVDVVGPRPDGALVAAAGGRLFTVGPDGTAAPFSAYSTEPGPEGYIAMSPGLDVAAGPTCRFEAGDVFVLEPATAPLGVMQVTVDGRSAGRFVDLPGVEALTGIAFDTTGRFGNKLLVAGRRQNRTTLFSVDCRGRVTVLTDSAPAIGGGMAVAPQMFGEHGGDLIGVDQNSGDVVFVRYDGTNGVLVASGLPVGGEVGVKALGFVPPEFLQRGATAYMADRRTPGPPTVPNGGSPPTVPNGGSPPTVPNGGDGLWRLTDRVLRDVGIDNNDLLVASQAGGRTVVVRCRATCRVLPLGQAAPDARVEGHITVVLGPPQQKPFAPYDPKGTVAFAVTTGVLVAGGFVLFFIHRERRPRSAQPGGL